LDFLFLKNSFKYSHVLLNCNNTEVHNITAFMYCCYILVSRRDLFQKHTKKKALNDCMKYLQISEKMIFLSYKGLPYILTLLFAWMLSIGSKL